MLRVPKAAIEMMNRKKEQWKNASWRQPLSASALKRIAEAQEKRNSVLVKDSFRMMTHERLLPEEIKQREDRSHAMPKGEVLHYRPKQDLSHSHRHHSHSSVRSGSDIFRSNSLINSRSTTITRIVHIKPKIFVEPEKEIQLPEAEQPQNEKPVQNNQINIEERQRSLIDDLEELKSVGSDRNNQNNGPKKKKKFKFETTKKQQAEKKKKEYPDERVWRMSRARKQNIYVMECEQIEPRQWAFIVKGNSGANYNIIIRAKLECNCPDFKNQKRLCKHLYYIINHVAKASKAIENLVGGLTLNDENLWDICKNLKDRMAGWQLQLPLPPGKKLTTVVKKLRDCQICFKRLGKVQYLQTCKTCTLRVHTICHKAFCEYRGRICPVCKNPFEGEESVEPTFFEKLKEELNQAKMMKNPQTNQKEHSVAEKTTKMASTLEDDPLAFLDD